MHRVLSFWHASRRKYDKKPKELKGLRYWLPSNTLANQPSNTTAQYTHGQLISELMIILD